MKSLGTGRLAFLLGLSFILVFGANTQDVLYGDGIYYLTIARDTLEGTAHPVGHHPLYLPILCAALYIGKAAGISLIQAGMLLSSLCGGIAVAIVFLLFMEWTGDNRVLSLFMASLGALTPNVFFFSTTIENHALHFLFVVLFYLGVTKAAKAGSIATAFLPGVLFVLAFLSHTTALMLGPLALFLYFHLRKRYLGRILGESESKWKLAFIPVLLLGPVVAVRAFMLHPLYSFLAGGKDPFHGHDPSSETIAYIFSKAGVRPGDVLQAAEYTFNHFFRMVSHVRDDWGMHMGICSLLCLSSIVFALLSRKKSAYPWITAFLLAFLPYAWLFSFWGFRPVEKGAYYLPTVPLALSTIAFGLLYGKKPPKRSRYYLAILAVATLCFQAFVSSRIISAHEKETKTMEWAKEAGRFVLSGNKDKGIVLTGTGPRLYYLKFLFPSAVEPYMFDQVLPAGESIVENVKLYNSWGRMIYMDDAFMEKAKKHEEFAKHLFSIPWKTIERGILKGAYLPPDSFNGTSDKKQQKRRAKSRGR